MNDMRNKLIGLQRFFETEVHLAATGPSILTLCGQSSVGPSGSVELRFKDATCNSCLRIAKESGYHE